VGEADFVRTSQLYARHALALDDGGRDLGEPRWHEADLVQRFPNGRAWFVVDQRALRERTRYGSVADLVDAAREAGGDVRTAAELPFALPGSPKLVEPPFVAVRVRAAVTHTIGGLRVDDHARVLDREGAHVPGLHAAGADAGGIFTGGYGSGLAAALVFGRAAAETALR
jgi:predicted oxidoreductase